MVKTIKVAGLVLRTRKYGEADHILSLLTPELGKVSAIAKGARKAKGSMRGKTQPFVYGEYLLYRGKSLYTVTQAEIINSFSVFGEDITKYGLASYVCEVADTVLLPDQPVPEVFPLILGVLYAASLDNDSLLLTWYRLQLLKILGYSPQFRACVLCGTLVQGGAVSFDGSQGGALCSSCSSQMPNLSGGARAALDFLLRIPLNKLSRVKLAAHIQHEVEEQAEKLINFNLERPVKSQEFLRCIKKD
jgi:DNA repair protein RecO (recombination protein O)